MASDLQCWLITDASHLPANRPSAHWVSQVNKTRDAIKRPPYRTMAISRWCLEILSMKTTNRISTTLAESKTYWKCASFAAGKQSALWKVFPQNSYTPQLCFSVVHLTLQLQSNHLSTQLRKSSCLLYGFNSHPKYIFTSSLFSSALQMFILMCIRLWALLSCLLIRTIKQYLHLPQ